MNCAINTRRATAIGLCTVVVVIGFAGSAAAHVEVSPATASQGAETEIAFRVPTEEPGVKTVKVQVSFPADNPIPSVQTTALMGWTATVQKTKLAKPVTTDDGKVTEAVSQITWSGGQIPSESYQDFPVAVGPLPSGTAKLTFKVLQTYSNGEVVRWIDSSEDAEHPAPTLTLTPASAAPAAVQAVKADATSKEKPATVKAAGSSKATAGLSLGAAGLALGLIGAVFGGLAWRRVQQR